MLRLLHTGSLYKQERQVPTAGLKSEGGARQKGCARFFGQRPKGTPPLADTFSMR